MDQTQNTPTWNEVPQAEIDRELAYWRMRRADRIWLVPCRYGDGSPTCSGSIEFPYSNPDRREYVLDCHWRREF